MFELKPVGAISAWLPNSSTSPRGKDDSAFVRFRSGSGCFGAAAIHSCAQKALPDPQSQFNYQGYIEPSEQFFPSSSEASLSRFALAAKSVGRLDFDVATNNGAVMDTCTAFLISDRYVMTAYHCTLDLDGNKPKVIKAGMLRMGYLSDARFGAAYSLKCTGGSACSPVEGDHQLDYAIFELTEEAQVKLKADGYAAVKFPSNSADLVPSMGQNLFVVHHPFGREQFITRAFCRVMAPADPSTPRFYDTCATLGGSSGAPVFDEASAEVIGIRVLGDKSHDEERVFTAAAVPISAIAAKSSIVREILSPSPPSSVP
jgi:hypothetical protein